VPVSELKNNFNVIYGSFAIEGGQVNHREGVLKIGPVEQKMVEVIVKKSKESGYAKGFNLKVDDVFSDEGKGICSIF
jgi:hypothetical protein